jgi:hypothetical protein
MSRLTAGDAGPSCSSRQSVAIERSVSTRFYSFELGGKLSGLVRERRAAGDYTLERVDRAGVWVDDPA